MGHGACQMCGGSVAPLGVLGDTHHGRCRNCGSDSAVRAHTSHRSLGASPFQAVGSGSYDPATDQLSTGQKVNKSYTRSGDNYNEPNPDDAKRARKTAKKAGSKSRVTKRVTKKDEWARGDTGDSYEPKYGA